MFDIMSFFNNLFGSAAQATQTVANNATGPTPSPQGLSNLFQFDSDGGVGFLSKASTETPAWAPWHEEFESRTQEQIDIATRLQREGYQHQYGTPLPAGIQDQFQGTPTLPTQAPTANRNNPPQGVSPEGLDNSPPEPYERAPKGEPLGPGFEDNMRPGVGPVTEDTPPLPELRPEDISKAARAPFAPKPAIALKQMSRLLPPEEGRAAARSITQPQDNAPSVPGRNEQLPPTPQKIDEVTRGMFANGERKMGAGNRIKYMEAVPSYSQRLEIFRNGGVVINFDTNAASGTDVIAPGVVIPNNASAEMREAAWNYARAITDTLNKRLGRNFKPWVRTKAENNNVGRPGTIHTEPFAVTDKQAVEFFTSEEGLRTHAKIVEETLGKIPGAQYSLPHNPPKGQYGAWGSGTNEVELAKKLIALL